MTDLSGKIEGVKPEEIARYLGMPIEKVEQAIKDGAKTWQDVYNRK